MATAEKITITYNDDLDIGRRDIDCSISCEGVIDTAMSVKKAIEGGGITLVLVPLEDNPYAFIDTLRRSAPDIIFNLCEGALGLSSMEMNVASFYELFGFRYTGSGPLTLGLCLNKGLAKNILCANSVPTPAYTVVKGTGLLADIGINFPLIVKPLQEDAGIGVDSSAVVHDTESLKKRVQYILDVCKQPALVEEYINGREFNVSVMGNGDDLRVLPVSEIDFSGLPEDMPRLVGYEAKWVAASISYKNTVPVCPAKVSEDLKERLSSIAVKAYRLMGCRDYARVDIRMGKDNVPKVLEVNPNPDISPDAGIARSAFAAGMTYSTLIHEIIKCAMSRYGCNE